MIDNTSAFNSFEYDRKIRQTMPYYEEYYRQIIELVKTVYKSPVNWLDIGCGTGMMGAAAFDQIQIKRFIFMDSSEAMINLTKERFSYPNAEFIVRDVRDLSVLNQFDVVKLRIWNGKGYAKPFDFERRGAPPGSVRRTRSHRTIVR